MHRRRISFGLRIGFALAICSLPSFGTDLSPNAPAYTAAGIVNAATQLATALAPNTIATIYGTNLSWTTHAVTSGDLKTGGALPTSLEGVTVSVNATAAGLFYVSPGQINFLVPYELTTATAKILVIRQSQNGPIVTVSLAPVSPAFFQWNGNLAVAEHADGTLISPAAPAQAGEIVVLYAAGLGRTSPDLGTQQVPATAMSILYAAQLQIWVNDSECPPANIYYAGVTPGLSGLYQINLKLPDPLPANPEIRIVIGDVISPAGIQLPAI